MITAEQFAKEVLDELSFIREELIALRKTIEKRNIKVAPPPLMGRRKSQKLTLVSSPAPVRREKEYGQATRDRVPTYQCFCDLKEMPGRGTTRGVCSGYTPKTRSLRCYFCDHFLACHTST